MRKDFHSRCDNMGPTLTLFKTDDGRICGGYTSQSWDSPEKADWKVDDKCFVFSVDLAKVFLVSSPSLAIYCSTYFGPYFGAGGCLAA